jgi:DNA polymerase-3 subunit delta
MSLPSCTWICSDEPLLIEEALAPLRQQARSQGYTREIFHIDHHFDWSQFLEQTQSLSLFSDKQFIECRLQAPKLSDDGKKALAEYLDNNPPDVCVVITSGKLESTTQKTAWFKKLSQSMKFQVIWPLQGQAFRQWIQARAQQHKLNLAPDAIEYLAAQTEGNLLAAKQAIERLSLLADDSALTVERLRALQHDASVYDLFDLVDCALSGNAAKTVHIFHQLIAQSTAPILILWALNREVTQLLGMKEGSATPYILPHRKSLIAKAMQRLEEKDLRNIVRQLGSIDACLKGMGESNGLDDLLSQYLRLCGSLTSQQKSHFLA